MGALLALSLTTSTASDEVLVEFHRSREEFEREWQAYLALPPFPGEPKLWHVAVADQRALNAAIDDNLRMMREGDWTAGRVAWAQPARSRHSIGWTRSCSVPWTSTTAIPNY